MGDNKNLEGGRLQDHHSTLLLTVYVLCDSAHIVPADNAACKPYTASIHI